MGTRCVLSFRRIGAGLCLALAVCAFATVPAADAAPPKNARQAPPPANPFVAPEPILRWINGYRAEPQPQKLPAAVRAMSALGLFKDLDASGIYVGFIAGVLGANPQQALGLVEKMFPLPPEDHVVIVRAIAYSGLPGWQDVLRQVAERMPARVVLIDRYLTGKMPTLAGVAIDTSPAALDMLWGVFYATGSYEPILRIIAVLPWSKDTDNVERLTIGSMAKWTLASNALREKDLLDMLKLALRHEPKKNQVIIREVIEAAETYETAKIRKDAIAAIEQLKARGPLSTRNTAWWGQAGQTALAFGCVVGSALGNAAIGVPCVVGGAASGAALKMLAPQP